MDYRLCRSAVLAAIAARKLIQRLAAVVVWQVGGLTVILDIVGPDKLRASARNMRERSDDMSTRMKTG
jgi:hypothetical protein